MTETPESAREARNLMLGWASGRRSWSDLGHDLFDPSSERAERELWIARMDVIEVEKWAAVYAAMSSAELAVQAFAGRIASGDF